MMFEGEVVAGVATGASKELVEKEQQVFILQAVANEQERVRCGEGLKKRAELLVLFERGVIRLGQDDRLRVADLAVHVGDAELAFAEGVHEFRGPGLVEDERGFGEGVL